MALGGRSARQPRQALDHPWLEGFMFRYTRGIGDYGTGWNLSSYSMSVNCLTMPRLLVATGQLYDKRSIERSRAI